MREGLRELGGRWTSRTSSDSFPLPHLIPLHPLIPSSPHPLIPSSPPPLPTAPQPSLLSWWPYESHGGVHERRQEIHISAALALDCHLLGIGESRSRHGLHCLCTDTAQWRRRSPVGGAALISHHPLDQPDGRRCPLTPPAVQRPLLCSSPPPPLTSSLSLYTRSRRSAGAPLDRSRASRHPLLSSHWWRSASFLSPFR